VLRGDVAAGAAGLLFDDSTLLESVRKSLGRADTPFAGDEVVGFDSNSEMFLAFCSNHAAVVRIPKVARRQIEGPILQGLKLTDHPLFETANFVCALLPGILIGFPRRGTRDTLQRVALHIVTRHCHGKARQVVA